MVVRRRPPAVGANVFAGAAAVYWLEVFPHVKREVRRWQRRALCIPDRRLARLALDTQADERGNLEGSAAFALLAPRRHRGEVIRAAVAFQALYDFLDTLAEQPAVDPVANGHSLHLALLAALDPRRPIERYFEHSGFGAGDGGYVEELVRSCRRALSCLPSWCAVAGLAQQAATRMVAYQSFNHDPADPDHRALRRWALTLTPASSGLEWWETAAGAASSLGVFALLAAAARPALTLEEGRAAANAYFPWVGALHVLLDSLVDLECDSRSGDHVLVGHYRGQGNAAERLGAIAAESMQRLAALGQNARHALILTAMASFYLSRPTAQAPAAAATTARVLATLGPSTKPAMALLRARESFR